MEEKYYQNYNLEEDLKKEILKNNNKELSQEEIKKLTEEANLSVEFLKKIDEIVLPSDKYVVFTDGEEQLLYENGEFYVISTTNSTKSKKKKTKKEATDMYLDYFIRYQLNPILDQKDIKKQKIEIMKKEREQEKIEMAKKILSEKDTPKEQKSVEEKTPIIE